MLTYTVTLDTVAQKQLLKLLQQNTTHACVSEQLVLVKLTSNSMMIKHHQNGMLIQQTLSVKVQGKMTKDTFCLKTARLYSAIKISHKNNVTSSFTLQDGQFKYPLENTFDCFKRHDASEFSEGKAFDQEELSDALHCTTLSVSTLTRLFHEVDAAQLPHAEQANISIAMEGNKAHVTYTTKEQTHHEEAFILQSPVEKPISFALGQQDLTKLYNTLPATGDITISSHCDNQLLFCDKNNYQAQLTDKPVTIEHIENSEVIFGPITVLGGCFIDTYKETKASKEAIKVSHLDIILTEAQLCFIVSSQGESRIGPITADIGKNAKDKTSPQKITVNINDDAFGVLIKLLKRTQPPLSIALLKVGERHELRIYISENRYLAINCLLAVMSEEDFKQCEIPQEEPKNTTLNFDFF